MVIDGGNKFILQFIVNNKIEMVNIVNQHYRYLNEEINEKQYEITDDGISFYELMIKSIGQINEYEIIKKSCLLLIEKMNIIKSFINSLDMEKDNNIATIDFENEDHMTIGIINYTLQNMKDTIEYSGTKINSYIQHNSIKLVLKTKPNKQPKEEIIKAIDQCKELFNQFLKEINKIKPLKVNKTVKLYEDKIYFDNIKINNNKEEKNKDKEEKNKDKEENNKKKKNKNNKKKKEIKKKNKIIKKKK